jgi:endonuclease V-like protein UPF0215 family
MNDALITQKIREYCNAINTIQQIPKVQTERDELDAVLLQGIDKGNWQSASTYKGTLVEHVVCLLGNHTQILPISHSGENLEDFIVTRNDGDWVVQFTYADTTKSGGSKPDLYQRIAIKPGKRKHVLLEFCTSANNPHSLRKAKVTAKGKKLSIYRVRGMQYCLDFLGIAMPKTQFLEFLRLRINQIQGE